MKSAIQNNVSPNVIEAMRQSAGIKEFRLVELKSQTTTESH